MNKYIAISVLAAGLLFSASAYAESNETTAPGMMMKERRADHPMMVFSSTSMPIMASGSMPMIKQCRTFSRGLALGMRGDDVKDLQEMLRENGFLDASSTGYFGPMTKKAVMMFQKNGGVSPTGFFGELSRKQHEKRCGDGRGRGDDKWENMGSSTKPLPCFTNATSTGCDHSNAFPPKMGSGTPPFPCMTKFDPSTGRPCKPKDDDDRPWGTTTPPSGIMCTMEARLCADGTMMPRDNMCVWHPEGCKAPATTTTTTASSTQ